MLGPSQIGRTCAVVISLCTLAWVFVKWTGKRAATYMANTKMQTSAT